MDSADAGVTSKPLQRGGTVERAADAIRSLIISRELFPGQQLRQDDLALRIGISRGPTREALQALSKEGVVSHTRNRGYTVTRLDLASMEQLYTLRDLAESHILSELRQPSQSELVELRRINNEIRNPETTVEQAMTLNKEFHFAIFGLSPHQLIVQEIDRWWKMSMAYRSFGIGVWSERAAMMADAHDLQIDALLEQDMTRLVELSREHRWVSLERLRVLLG